VPVAVAVAVRVGVLVAVGVGVMVAERDPIFAPAAIPVLVPPLVMFPVTGGVLPTSARTWMPDQPIVALHPPLDLRVIVMLMLVAAGVTAYVAALLPLMRIGLLPVHVPAWERLTVTGLATLNSKPAPGQDDRPQANVSRHPFNNRWATERRVVTDNHVGAAGRKRDGRCRRGGHRHRKQQHDGEQRGQRGGKPPHRPAVGQTPIGNERPQTARPRGAHVNG